MDQQRITAKLLRLVADLVERHSTAELQDLVAGRASLTIDRADRATPRDGGRTRDLDKRRQPSRDMSGIAAQLRTMASREAGRDLLDRLQFSKRDLEALARTMDLPVVREDDSEQLRKKIIELSIGARLNSQAIRGE